MSTPQSETRPLRETIRELAIAIAEGQAELDRSVVEIQRELTREFEEGELDYPLTAQQFRFADTTIDLKLVVSRTMKPEQRPDESAPRAFKPIVNATMLSPDSRQRETVERELVSTVSTRIVPVPSEPQADER